MMTSVTTASEWYRDKNGDHRRTFINEETDSRKETGHVVRPHRTSMKDLV